MTKYYIFRHGQTLNSKYRLPYPKDNRQIKILKDSIPALKKMAEYLKNISPDLCVSSEYLRCQQTTKIITKITGVKFKKEPRLNEFGGETFLEFTNRINNFLEEVKINKYRTIIICTHGAGIATIKNLLIKGRMRRRDLPFYPKPGILLCIEGKNIQRIDFNKNN